MKKYSLILLLFLPLFSLFAQQEIKEEVPRTRKNELKLDIVKILTKPAIELEYERMLGNWSSVGGYFQYGDGGEEIFRNFRLGGFYRGYFTQRKEYGTKGFYGELLTGYYSGKTFGFYDSSTYESKNYDGLELGFKLGYKWVNKSGFIIQTDIGLSRGLIKNEYSPTNFLLTGVKIGWGF